MLGALVFILGYPTVSYKLSYYYYYKPVGDMVRSLAGEKYSFLLQKAREEYRDTI